jgi:transposase
MAYSKDLRERVIEYIKEGNTQEKTSAIFKVDKSTIKRWLKLQKETGSLEKKELEREAAKFKSTELNEYNEKNPNALLKDIAQYFGGSISGAFYALEREKITLKKKRFTIKKETRMNALNLKKN